MTNIAVYITLYKLDIRIKWKSVRNVVATNDVFIFIILVVSKPDKLGVEVTHTTILKYCEKPNASINEPCYA